MIKLLLSVFLLLTSITSDAYSFNFDVWESGKDIKEVIEIARENNIPILKTGIVSVDKNFNPKIVSKYLESTKSFTYNTKLLNSHAKVFLYFTPESRLLYKVNIRWNHLKDEENFLQDLLKVINDKYGDNYVHYREIIFEYYKWKTETIESEDLITIQLSAGGKNLNLEYLDSRLNKQNEKEVLSTKDQKMENAYRNDRDKF